MAYFFNNDEEEYSEDEEGEEGDGDLYGDTVSEDADSDEGSNNE